MAKPNTPVAEPYQTRGLKRRERARLEKWPDMRFCEASLYPCGKQSQTPQYIEFMDMNEDYVLLAVGNGKESTQYAKAEEGPLYVGASMALLGEPLSVWKQKQKDWQDRDEFSRTQAVKNEHGMVTSQEAQESTNTLSYAETAGEKN